MKNGFLLYCKLYPARIRQFTIRQFCGTAIFLAQPKTPKKSPWRISLLTPEFIAIFWLLALAFSVFLAGCLGAPQIGFNTTYVYNASEGNASGYSAEKAFEVVYWHGGGLAPVPWYESITITGSGQVVREKVRGEAKTVRTLNLTYSEFEEFKKIVLGANVFNLENEYTCGGECPEDLPGVRLNITIEGNTKSIFIYLPEGLPPGLNRLLDGIGDFVVRLGAEEGEFCGGIAGILCTDGLECIPDANYPDAGGVCMRTTK